MTLPPLMTPAQLHEARAPVRMVTTVEADGVHYQVFSGLFPIWAKYVPFKRTRAFRPGGPAFRSAARAQESFASECVERLRLSEAIATRFEQGR